MCRRCVWLGFVVALTLALGGCSGADQRGALDDLSLAGRLAVIHNNRGPVMPSDALIERFERLLLDLDAKCPETRSEIADMGVFAQRQLADAGRDDTLLDVFRAASDGIPVEAAEIAQCSEVFAALLTMLTP